MKLFHSCLLILVILLCGASFVSEAKVVYLTPRNYRYIIHHPQKSVFVFFHLNWCSPCVRFLESWEELSNMPIWENRSDIVFALANCSQYSIFEKSFNVEEYPKLVLFTPENKLGKIEYVEKLKQDKLIDFINKHSPAPPQE